MFKLKPLEGTVRQWRKIFTGLDFMGDDLDKRFRYIPRPDIDTGTPILLKYLDYLRIKTWLTFPPNKPKKKFEQF